MCTPSSVYHDGADGTMPQARGGRPAALLEMATLPSGLRPTPSPWTLTIPLFAP